MVCYDLAHQIRWAKHTFSGRVISHQWCAARLVGIAHHRFYSVDTTQLKLALETEEERRAKKGRNSI